jgi:hypothetical protein
LPAIVVRFVMLALFFFAIWVDRAYAYRTMNGGFIRSCLS